MFPFGLTTWKKKEAQQETSAPPEFPSSLEVKSISSWTSCRAYLTWWSFACLKLKSHWATSFVWKMLPQHEMNLFLSALLPPTTPRGLVNSRGNGPGKKYKYWVITECKLKWDNFSAWLNMYVTTGVIYAQTYGAINFEMFDANISPEWLSRDLRRTMCEKLSCHILWGCVGRNVILIDLFMLLSTCNNVFQFYLVDVISWCAKLYWCFCWVCVVNLNKIMKPSTSWITWSKFFSQRYNDSQENIRSHLLYGQSHASKKTESAQSSSLLHITWEAWLKCAGVNF